MKKYLRYGIYLLIIGIIVLVISNYFKAKNTPTTVTTAIAELKDINVSINSSGKIQPKTTYSLNFPSGGKISYMPYEEGDTIEEGAVVAVLDSRDVKEQTNKAWTDYKYSLEKIREFEDNNKDKPKDTKYTISYNELAAQRDGYAAIVAQNLVNQTNKTLVSPITGIITQVNAKAGELATATQPIISVADLRELEFVAEVDEQDTGRLTEGLEATVELDAFGDQPFEGEVRDIAKVAKINSTGGTYYPTKITLTNTTPFIRTGMNGDSIITTDSKTNALLIPTEAIAEEENSKYVYTFQSGIAKKTIVKTGLQNETETEILKGLQAGDTVITTDPEKISDNMKVQVDNTNK